MYTYFFAFIVTVMFGININAQSVFYPSSDLDIVENEQSITFMNLNYNIRGINHNQSFSDNNVQFKNSENYIGIKSDLDFVVNTIKNNYPAYSEKVNSKFTNQAKKSKKNIAQNSSPISNFTQLASVVLFFKDLHLRLSSTKPIFFDSTFCKVKLQQVQTNHNVQKKRDPKIGYWKSDYNDCIIYLQKCEGKNNLLEAVIIESKNKNSKPGNIKFYITNNKVDDYYFTNYISARNTISAIYSYFLSSDTLISGLQYKWTKIKNYYPGYLQKLPLIEDKVLFNRIDSNFAYIKIPKSDWETKAVVDSLVKKNRNIIEKTPNLIIDIRNNIGGTWSVYNSLFPYIYTDPMIGGEQWRKCSEDFIEKQRQSIEEAKKDSNLINFLPDREKDLDSMIKYKDSYYHTNPDTIQFDSIKAFPKKVIILVNYRCISASEMFIKFCQQSKKTIIAGEKTWGALDNVGLVSFDSPSGNLRLTIPRTKNFYEKGRYLDFVGITPNINILSTETDWIKFIINYSSYKK